MLCDFGASKNKELIYQESIKTRYSIKYASLEQLQLKEAEPYFDMWALGVLVFKMMVGEEPFPFDTDS